MILPCTCQHETQSRWYGSNNRVHNEFRDGAGNLQYRCTVCLAERGTGKTPPTKGKTKGKKK